MAEPGRIHAVSSEYRIVDALNADWQLLQGGRGSTVQQWAIDHPALARCRTLDDVLLAVRVRPDAAMAALLGEESSGDQLGARVVLQAMLGKVVRMAGRDARAEVDDYVAAMWCRIRTYPLSDRPSRVAANLALDTLKSVKQETQWSRHGDEVVAVPPGAVLDRLYAETLDRAGADHNTGLAASTADSVLAAAGELGLIDSHTRQVLTSVYADGLSGRDAAERHQTTPAMIRFRCSRGVRHLAEHSNFLLDAA